MLLNDVLINQMAGRARALTDVRIFDANNISWAWGRANNYHYGRQVIDVIGALLMEYPDPQALAREQDACEHAFSQLQTMARGEHHAKLVAIFDACYHAVESQTTEKMITKGRGANRVSEPERRCRLFMQLPKRNVCHFFYLNTALRLLLALANILRCHQVSDLHGAHQETDSRRRDKGIQFSR